MNAAGCGIDENGQRFIRVKGVRWFTNLEHGRRHQPLQLMSMADNIKYSRHKEVKGVGYRKYDNYDAIEVPFTDAIPSDYDGVMGVPISFLDRYCPEQFDLVGSFNASSLDDKTKYCYVPSRDTVIVLNGKEQLWNGPVVDRQPLYKRVCIRHKQGGKK